MPPTTAVAVVGAGALGSAMASRLGETGHDVRLWNRTGERARAAAEGVAGVTAFDSLSEAIFGASAVITVLRDGEAVATVMADVVGQLERSGVWIQASTIGPTSARSLADMAAEHGVPFLDAPVSGSTAPARQGKLVWLVAGSEEALARARPILDDLGSSVLHVGTGVQGSSLKLVVNAWMTTATVAMSDSLSLCDTLDIDHASFTEALEAGPLSMPYALQKMQLMDERSFDPGFATELALKDIDLARSSAGLTALLQVVHDRLERTVTAGHGGDDLAAVDIFRGADLGRS
jgi:3-hydroxyisobutyrate dehydrogenase